MCHFVSILCHVKNAFQLKTKKVSQKNYKSFAKKIDDEIKKLLSPGGYDGKLIIHMYDPNTGEKAMIDVDANLLIMVVE